MAIKPIGKTNRSAVVAKIGILVFVIGLGFLLTRTKVDRETVESKAEVLSSETGRTVEKSVSELADNIVEQSKDVVGDVLGDATDMVDNLASYSANTVSSFIIDKATAPLIDQINKLPPIQQEEMKKNICR